MTEKAKRPENLKDHIKTILHGTEEEKERLIKRHFFLADTPQFMKDLGLRGEFFSVRYGVISRHNNKDADHDLLEQNWVDLCESIKEPFTITKYGNGFRLFTRVKVKGQSVVVGVGVKNAGKNFEINAITTAFDYRDRPMTGEILYTATK